MPAIASTDEGRECSAGQKAAEALAEAAESVASTATQVAAGAGAVGLVAVGVTRRVPVVAPVTVRAVTPAAYVGIAATSIAGNMSGLATLARMASGDGLAAALSQQVNNLAKSATRPMRGINKFAKDVGLGDIGGDYIADQLDSVVKQVVGSRKCK